MSNDNNQIIERYGSPSEYDQAPYLSILANMQDGPTWVQISRDEERPLWQEFDCLQDAQDFVKNKKKS